MITMFPRGNCELDFICLYRRWLSRVPKFLNINRYTHGLLLPGGEVLRVPIEVTKYFWIRRIVYQRMIRFLLNPYYLRESFIKFFSVHKFCFDLMHSVAYPAASIWFEHWRW